MTRCTPGDALHLADGTHRTTARSANGRELDRFDGQLAQHLARLEEDQREAASFELAQTMWRIDLGTTPIQDATRAHIAALEPAHWRRAQPVAKAEPRFFTDGPAGVSAIIEAAIEATR